MKKFLFALFLCGLVRAAYAMDPVTVRMGQPDSTWEISQSTITVSSATVTTIAAVTGYRVVHISNLASSGTTIYYRIDGSTASIPTVGFPIAPTERDHAIESNAVISLQLTSGAPGTTLNNVPTKTLRK
jgi:hypothetical protein